MSPKLPTSDELASDTAIAAPGDPAEGFGFVGVWALNQVGCSIIDTPAIGKFAVITKSTYRDGAKASFGHFGPAVDGQLTITARAASGTRTFELSQTSPDTLNIDGTDYVRCTL